jgi:hypothetical protein
MLLCDNAYLNTATCTRALLDLISWELFEYIDAPLTSLRATTIFTYLKN